MMPLGAVIFLLLLALFFLRRGKQRTSAVFLVLGLAVLWTASTPFVAAQLLRQVESRYPAVAMEQVPRGGCVIVLGGAVGAPIPPRVDIDMSEAIDRVYQTAALYRAGKAPVVIVTGGNQPWSESKTAEADLIRDLLVEWGVPRDAIFLEGSSRNTRENALYSKNILNAISCNNPLLVTSAAHMPRAVAAFSRVGVTVTPVSTDVRAVGLSLPGVMDFIPSADALATTSEVIREWIGQKVYAWQGWN
jgi:uncharacterized SAM-binding protein YcdF (DUF218 family)